MAKALSDDLYAQLDAELLALTVPDTFPKMRKLERQYEMSFTKSNVPPWELIAYIRRRPELFRQNPVLRFATDFSRIACETAKSRDTIATMDDLSKFVLDRLRAECDVDYSYDHVKNRLRYCLEPDDQVEILNLLQARHSQIQEQAKIPPIQMSAEQAMRRRFEQGATEIFRAETQRPGRGDRREAGGRAGLGPQKPDLWKPEQK